MKPGRAALPLVLILLLAVACGPRPQVATPSDGGSPAAGGSPSAGGRAEGRRLLSLAPNLTETVYALGLGAQVVAVTDNDHYPPEVERLPHVGDIQPDYERILALKPDLVLVDHNLNNPEIPPRLESLGLPILAVKTRTLDDLQDNLPVLGRALSAQEQAAAALANFQAGLREVSAKAAALPRPPRVFVEIWGEPLMTAGNTSLVHEMVERAGGRNLYADLSETYPTISLEDLVHRDPDILVLTTMAPADLARRAGWDRLSAVRNGRVHRIDPDLLVRPTLRSLEGLRQMIALFEAWQP